MKTCVIAGAGWALEQACATALQAGVEHQRLELPCPDGYNFDIQALTARYPRDATQVFVALDERAINGSRQQLIIQVRFAGFTSLHLLPPSVRKRCCRVTFISARVVAWRPAQLSGWAPGWRGR